MCIWNEESGLDAFCASDTAYIIAGSRPQEKFSLQLLE